MIKGVEVKDLKIFLDDRGYLYEITRFNDKIFNGEKIKQTTFSHLFPDAVKAFHYHKNQTDWVVCVEGNVKLIMVDFREHLKKGIASVEGKEEELRNKLVPVVYYLGERKPMLIKVPKGVWHGYTAVGGKPASIIYFTDQVYNSEDEHRIPWDFFGKKLWEVENK
ncbi:MAG: dTDP-4-dehydrorhamnose 3,5-epimerase family protein [Candidatus Diapherotrites archaeon]